MTTELRKTGKLLIEAAQRWEELIAALKESTGPSRTLRLELPGEDEYLSLEIFNAENLMAFAFIEKKKKKRGVALPFAERSEG